MTTQPPLRRAGAPVPPTPQAAEVERTEHAMAAAWDAWAQIERRNGARVSQEEVAASYAFKAALEAHETALVRLHAREQREQTV